jgi:hypothetical protein
MVVAKLLFEARFTHFKSLLTSNKYLLIYGKEKNLVLNWFNLLLFGAQAISLSILIYFLYAAVYTGTDTPQFLYLKINSFLVLAIAFKYFFEKMIATTFELDSLIEQYNFQKLSYRNLLSVYLLPANILLIYASLNNTLILFILASLAFLFIIATTFMIFRDNQKLIFNNLFYFILYLCALEIAPYLIVYKIVQ